MFCALPWLIARAITKEIYNETIRDLLADDGHAPLHTPLDVREDASGRIVVAGLSEHQPRSGDQVMALLERGSANRTKCPTKANEDSSRSHAVFQINIQQRDRTGGVAAEVRTATLTLCDLAGSERASATENRGQQMREGANINRYACTVSYLFVIENYMPLADDHTRHIAPFLHSAIVSMHSAMKRKRRSTFPIVTRNSRGCSSTRSVVTVAR